MGYHNISIHLLMDKSQSIITFINNSFSQLQTRTVFPNVFFLNIQYFFNKYKKIENINTTPLVRSLAFINVIF